MVFAEEASVIGAFAPVYASIVTAWNAAAAPPAMRWVGDSPRVTRVYDVLLGTRTRVAQPIKVDDPSLSEDEAAQIIAQHVHSQLAALSLVPGAWHPTRVIMYNPAINGPMSFWQSGDAARTRTFDTPPGPTNALDTPENPVGPNDQRLRPMTPGESLDDFLRRNTGIGTPPWLWIALAAAGLWYFGGFVKSAGNLLESATEPTPRKPKKA